MHRIQFVNDTRHKICFCIKYNITNILPILTGILGLPYFPEDRDCHRFETSCPGVQNMFWGRLYVPV